MTKTILLLAAVFAGATLHAQVNFVRTYNEPVDGTPNTGMFVNAADGTFGYSTLADPTADPAFAGFTHLLTYDGLVYAQAGYGIFTDGFGIATVFNEGDPVFALDSFADTALLGDTAGQYQFLGFSTDSGETTGFLRYIYGPSGVSVYGFGFLEPSAVGQGGTVLASSPAGGGSTAAQRRTQQQAQRVAAQQARAAYNRR